MDSQAKPETQTNLANAIAALVDLIGGIELDIPMRPIDRALPDFRDLRADMEDGIDRRDAK